MHGMLQHSHSSCSTPFWVFSRLAASGCQVQQDLQHVGEAFAWLQVSCQVQQKLGTALCPHQSACARLITQALRASAARLFLDAFAQAAGRHPGTVMNLLAHLVWASQSDVPAFLCPAPMCGADMTCRPQKDDDDQAQARLICMTAHAASAQSALAPATNHGESACGEASAQSVSNERLKG